MMHAKVMVVDRLLSVFDTANFDNRSFEMNDEIGVAATDPVLAATLTRAFEDDLKRSRTVDARSVETPPALQQAAGAVLGAAF